MHFDLQYFADAGTLVNATGNFVNAGTGETTDFDSAHSLSSELKAFYDTELLENARSELFYAQFAKRQPLPANHHGVVEWRKWNTFDKAAKLTEGVIPTGQKFGVTAVTGTVDQYGTYTAITDKLELRAYDDVILGATEEMGASAAETQEALIRDALFTNTNVLYCDKITRATGAVAATPAAQSALVEDASCHCHLTPEMVNRAVTVMKKNRVPRIGGKYCAVIHPSVAHDLRNDESWIEAHKYASPEEIFNGEIGELHGVRFIENVFAPVFRGENLASDSPTLTVNHADGYSGAITSITFDGGTVAEDALIGRKININGVTATITDNTATTLTFASTNFGTVANDAVIYPGEGGKQGISVFSSLFFGQDAYGVTEIEGGGLQTIVKQKGSAGTADPLDQRSSVGWKAMLTAEILIPEYLIRVEHASKRYSATAQQN